MSDKNSPPLASHSNESFPETNRLSLWHSCGNDWRWRLKTSSINHSFLKRNTQSSRVEKPFIQGEVLLTAVLLVVAIALNCVQKTSAFETGKFNLFQSSSVEHETSR